MTTFLQKAATTPKPSKKDAAASIQSLVQHLNVRGDNDFETFAALAGLYAHFLPPAPKGLKKASTDHFAWVAMAVDPKDRRKYLRYVFADGARIIGADGCAVHIAPDERPAGYYCPSSAQLLWAVGDTQAVGYPGRFPDVDRILAHNEGKSVDVDTLVETQTRELKKGLSINIAAQGASWDVNSRYLEPARAPMQAGDRVIITRHVLRFEMQAFGGCTAIVNGLRTGEQK